MKKSNIWSRAAVLVLGAALPLSVAHAQIKVSTYSASVLNDGANAGPFAIGKVVSKAFVTTDSGSKVVIKTDNKIGDGGLSIQMILKGVDCAAYVGPDDEGNDSSKPAKCGVGKHGLANPATPVQDHVLEIGINFGGTDVGATSLLYTVDKGVGAFELSGKNKVAASQISFFGLLPAGSFVLGINQVRLHAALRACDDDGACTSDADCETPDEACDTTLKICHPAVTCTSNADCSSGDPGFQTCTGGVCATACNDDPDCTSLVGTSCLTNAEREGCLAGPLGTATCFAGTTYGLTGATISNVR